MRIEILLIGISVILPLASEKPFKNVNIQMSEIRFQLGDIGQWTKEELLEWELSNGNVSSMELMEKVLSGRSLDAHLFDEYVQMDISNGIEELNELADEWKRAKELNVKEEDRKKILDALDGLKDLKVPNSSKTAAELEVDITKFRSRIKVSINEKLYNNYMRWNLLKILEFIEDIVKKYPRNLTMFPTSRDDVETIGSAAYSVSKLFWNIGNVLEDISEHFFAAEYLNVDPRKRLDEVIRIIEDATDKVRSLQSPVLKALGKEMNSIETLRDAKLVEKVKELAGKLEDTVSKMAGVGIQNEMLEDYRNVESASEFLQKVSNFSYSVSRVVRQFSTLKRRWTPLTDHFNALQLPSGNLSALLGNLRRCPSFPVDYQKRINESITISEPLIRARELELKLEDFMSKLRRHNFTELSEKFERAVKYVEEFRVMESFWNFNQTDFGDILEALELTGEDAEMTVVGNWSREYYILTSNIDFPLLIGTIKDTEEDLSKAEERIKCLSELPVAEAGPFIELPPKVWDFDPKPTRHLVETVLGFKKIHRMIVELNEWKFETNMESFGLDEQDVNAIQKGIEVVEQLGDIDGLLKEMNELSGINGSEVEEAWQTVRTALIQLNSELSDHLPPIDTNLTNLRSAISVIQLPSDLPIQLIINWVNGNLKGVVRSEYENTLQRLIRMDFANYSKKLDEMSHAIGKWSGNKGSAEEDEKEEEDCLVVMACVFLRDEDLNFRITSVRCLKMSYKIVKLEGKGIFHEIE
uniref:WSN domain-containing protein n=1 Tax=Caenorhabditis tropicalis TaxID=1561998 RepID=A0A1I7UDW3_9PELO